MNKIKKLQLETHVTLNILDRAREIVPPIMSAAPASDKASAATPNIVTWTMNPNTHSKFLTIDNVVALSYFNARFPAKKLTC